MMSINQFALKEILLEDFIRYLRWSFKTKYNSKIILTDSHIKICKHLVEVYKGNIKKLVINMPPRSGKTEIVNTFIEWTITKHPQSKYIMTSYSDTLVANSSQQIRDTINSLEHKDLFNLETKKDTQSKKLWKTNANGGVYAVSSFGQITGHGAGLKSSSEWGGCIIVDDPLKPDDANSILKLDKIKDWYETTLSNRVNNPNVPIIIIMQRLHTNDLVGCIEQNKFKDKDEWTFLKIKAVDDEYNISFWEDFYPIAKLEQMKNSNSFYYYSQFQQEPIVRGGNFFNTDWIKYVKRDIVNEIKFEKRFITVDTALKAKEQNDYTVYSAFGVFEKRLYLLDMFRGKPLSKAREITAKDFYNRNNAYPFKGMYIEQKASGVDLFQRMKEDGYMVYEVERNVDKVFRAEQVAPYIETYGLYIVEDLPNITDFLGEYTAFPNAVHDDMIDTLIDGVQIAYIDKTGVDYSVLTAF